jgi:hypothetical protein
MTAALSLAAGLTSGLISLAIGHFWSLYRRKNDIGGDLRVVIYYLVQCK